MINSNKYYFCPNCGKNYRWHQDVPGVRIVCAVMHGPGECCHCMEEEVPDDASSVQPKTETDLREV